MQKMGYAIEYWPNLLGLDHFCIQNGSIESPRRYLDMMHDEVVSRLRHVLTEGETPPGARIPERELCASFAISRTPLREALKVLAAEGLVVLLPNRGSRAAKLTQNDVKELFEVCEALEAAAG